MVTKSNNSQTIRVIMHLSRPPNLILVQAAQANSIWSSWHGQVQVLTMRLKSTASLS